VRSTIDSSSRLQDRRAERGALDRLIGNARAGTSGAVVLRGEAGIGKSALLDHVLAHAAGCRVVRAAGVESEMELAFAGLHQLCAPFLDRLDRLPAPQHDALGTAFGLRAGDPPDRFLVGLAVLSLLSDVAEEQPLVCILDDTQWLDRASAQVLGFVARRLVAEAVVLVFAVRDPSDDADLDRLPELLVGPLGDSDARALLASAIPGRMDEAVRDRIIAEAQGNPLALLELPRGWTPDAFAGGFGMPDGVPVSARIEESCRRRLAPLPEQTRLLLLAAAAEPGGDPVLVWATADRLGIPVEAGAPAREAGLLAVGTQLRFRHPLVRSVVYREAGADDRRLVHSALAAATDPALDPDRRAWHRAAATAGQDEEVAAELVRSAGRAQSRGGQAAAAAFLQRAVALTGDPAPRAERALAAAQASLAAGAFDVARTLLGVAEVGPLDELGRARVALLRAETAFAQNRGGDAPLLLLQAAKKLETLDVRLSRNTYLEAWGAALFAGGLASAGSSLPDISRAVATAPDPADPPLPSDLLLDGLGLVFTEGRPAAAPVLRDAVAAYGSPDVSVEEMLRWGWLATRAANLLWDYESCLGIGERAVQLARESGALEALAVADNAYGQAAVFRGDFATATLLIAEVEAVREATGTRIAPHAALVLAGFRGQEREATELIDGILSQAPAVGQGTAVQYGLWAKSVLMNGLGRYEEALAAAVKASEVLPQLHVAMWALSELIEAATRIDNAELAERGLARLGEQTEASATDWALGIQARSRALLSEGEAAEPLYREAIERLGRTRLLPEFARAHLLYGEWLRREGRRIDAREHLRTAHDMIATIGMEAFAERARRELLATGERVRRRTVETRDDLTPQEEQIGRLARDGLSNAEIGARLFLSPRTVEWHLRKVFSKLGVSSRKALREALPRERRPGVPA
jgi:DNA-binding CsgD family transcriptional regulator/tetratricopeptide (TPR) repeat protein